MPLDGRYHGLPAFLSMVVLEGLEGLRDNAKKGEKFNKRLALWFYRRMQFCIDYEVKERGLRVVQG